MAERRYTKNGEWALRTGTTIRVGLTPSATEELGELTFLGLPKVGAALVAGEAACVVEAVKAAADYYTPLSGRVVETNTALAADPAAVNRAPLDGWLFALAETDAAEWDSLLDEAAWRAWESGS